MNIFSCRLRFEEEFPEKRVWESLGETPGTSEAPKEGKEGAGEECGEKKPPTEERNDLAKELNNEGEAKDYVETFKKSGMFDVFASSIEYAKNFPEVEGFQNFEDWKVTDPEALAEFFATCNFVPNGKGKTEFIKGLRGCPNGECKTPEAQEAFDKSRRTLKQLMELLREYEKMKRESRVDTKAQVGKSAMGETVGGGIETLLKSYNRASGTEKLMILGSIGIGIAILYKIKDAALPGTSGKIKYSSLFMGLGAILGVNYLSGKISKDGKSLLQRLDLFRDVDELQEENAMRGFAEHNNLVDNQEKLRTLLRVQGLSMKELYRLYKEASGTDDRSIDPKKVGFQKQEIDGKALYEITDLLVQITSLNESEKAAREEAEKSNVPYSGLTDEAKAEAKMPGNAKAAFEDKYFHGELSRADLTVFDVISNEYTMTAVQQALREGKTPDAIWRQHIEKGKAKRSPDRALKLAQQGYKWTYINVKHYGKEAAEWTWDKMKRSARFLNQRIFTPTYSWAAARWNRYAPKVEGYFDDKISYLQLQDLEKVLPPEFDVRITKAETDMFREERSDLGKATIMGVPEIEFAIYVRKDDGAHVAVINNIEFLLDDGKEGNKQNAEKLQDALNTKARAIFSEYEKKIPQVFHGLIPNWDPTKRRWKVTGIKVDGDSNLGIPKQDIDLHFSINPDGKTITVYNGEQVIFDEFSKNKINRMADVDDLNDTYIDAQIEGALWGTDPKLEKHLKGLHFERKFMHPGDVIEGRLGGLRFFAKNRDASDISKGFVFSNQDDGSSPYEFDKLTIPKEEGGQEFLSSLTGKILEDPEFIGPFNLLKAQMENTGDGVLTHLGEFVKTRRLWIIPTNGRGLLNGKILQKLWDYEVDFKMFETLDMFQHSLEGKTLGDIPVMFKKYITNAIDRMTELSRHIDSLSEEDKANEFEKLLSGDAVVSGGKLKVPAGIERLNYHNDKYQKLFLEFRGKITSDRYNYEGIDKSEVGKSYYEIYFTLLRVWSFHTNKYALTPNGRLTVANEEECRKVLDRVIHHLEIAQKSGNVIKQDELPGKGKPDEEALKEWMKA